MKQVEVPGPLGESAVEILESLPNLSLLNGVSRSRILESGKHVIDSMLRPRLPEWSSQEPLTDHVINAMWLYLMNYRLADEEKIDETSVWYIFIIISCPSVLFGCDMCVNCEGVKLNRISQWEIKILCTLEVI